MNRATAVDTFVPATNATELPRVGFIVGPTGVGKTRLALAVAEALGAEIVNADSRQLYRGMDIGTAKPSATERRRVPHHLIDIAPPDHPLDAAEFGRLGGLAITAIVARGRTVLVVGGSGLYLRALRSGMFPGPPAAPQIRLELNDFADRWGTAGLHARLAQVDSIAAARLSPNDRMRIVRALEVFELTGVPLSVQQARHACGTSSCVSVMAGLTLPREKLYARIEQRFDQMMAAGLVDEVRALLHAGYDRGVMAHTIGYREIVAYLTGALDRATAIERAKRESRRLAKRQFTWFRADAETVWFDADAEGTENSLVALFANFFRPQQAIG